MNSFELVLADALRAEAEEIAMSIDSHRAADELESRLDDADRSRHRTYWVAAAVVILMITGVVALTGSWPKQNASVLPGQTPSPAASHVTYTSSIFVVPFSVSMPSWLSEHEVYSNGIFGNNLASPHEMSWQKDGDCDPCPDGSDLALRFVSPSGIYRPGDAEEQPVPPYEDYLAILRSMESTYGLAISESEQTTVDGRPTTVMSLTPTQDVSGASFACPEPGLAADECWWPTVGARLRLAVVDEGDAPLLIWVRANATNPSWPAITQDFSTMLRSIRLGTAPGPSGS